jgi:hypothetical protein
VRADTHRYKLETAMMFEAMKSDFENFGSKVWYMTLRQDKHDQVASMV